MENYSLTSSFLFYITQVAEHCPKALSTYLALWRSVDQNNKVHIYKNEIKTKFLTSTSKFNHDLLLLAKEALLSIEETPNVLHIELVSEKE